MIKWLVVIMILNKQIKDWSIDSKLKLEAKKRAYTYIKLLFQLILFRIRKGGKESYIYIYIYCNPNSKDK